MVKIERVLSGSVAIGTPDVGAAMNRLLSANEKGVSHSEAEVPLTSKNVKSLSTCRLM